MIQHNKKLILGVDMGNYNMKTAHVCFPSAYMELAGDGNNYRHTLRCGGRVYALGGKRVAQRDDKASMNEDFLILTQFAIAMELEACRLGAGTYDISLATALPPAYLTSREMRSSLKQFFRRQMDFRYNGRRYRVNITKVYVCPQGIAAAYAGVRTEGMEQGKGAFGSPIELLAKEAISVLVDIGGGTVDPVVLKYGLPQPMEDENPAKGIIWTYSNIRRDIKAKTGQDISEEAINMTVNGEPVRMDETSLEIIQSHMDSYANRLFMELKEKGLPFATSYTIVQGGGAGFVRSQWKQLSSFAALDFLPEIRATAMGCEVMARRMMLREEQRPEKRVV